MNVLVVSENEAIPPRVIEALGDTHTVTHTLSLGAGCEQARLSPPDLILVDSTLLSESPVNLFKAAGVRACPIAAICEDPETEKPDLQSLQSGIFDVLSLDDLQRHSERILARAAHLQSLLRDRDNAIKELARKEEHNFALFQHSPLPMVVVDREGNVVKSNLAMRNQAAPLPELGVPLFDIQDESFGATTSGLLRETIESGQVKTIVEIRQDSRFLSITMAPLPDGAVVIIEDITAQKLAQAEAERQHEQLIQADKMVALGTLVSGVAHEISNPNNVMILSANALEKMISDLLPSLDHYRELEGDFYVGPRPYDEIREELPDMAMTLQRAAERVKVIVGDLKTFARPDSATLDEGVDVNEVVEASVSLVRALIKKSTSSFSMSPAESLPTIQGNPQRLEQVIVNLLTNACQALNSSMDAILVRTFHDNESHCICVEVRDEGGGISADDLKRITDPFFTTKHDTGGTGLGLSISHKIAQAHGGRLEFESIAGEGTTARLVLPVSEEN